MWQILHIGPELFLRVGVWDSYTSTVWFHFFPDSRRGSEARKWYVPDRGIVQPQKLTSIPARKDRHAWVFWGGGAFRDNSSAQAIFAHSPVGGSPDLPHVKEVTAWFAQTNRQSIRGN